MSASPARVAYFRSNAVECLISRREVEQLTSLSRSTLYDLIRKKKFPAAIAVSERRRAWLLSEITTWIEQKCSEGVS